MPGQWVTVVDGSVSTKYWRIAKVWDDDGQRAGRRKDNRLGFSRAHHILWPMPWCAEVYGHLVPHVDPAITHPGLLETVVPTEIVTISDRWVIVDQVSEESVAIHSKGGAHRAAKSYASDHMDSAELVDALPDLECTPVDGDGVAVGPMVKVRLTCDLVFHAEWAL